MALSRQKFFQQACAALWGQRWQVEAARQLGVGRSTAYRYDVGDREVPQAIVAQLIELLVKRQGDIEMILARAPAGA